MARVGSVVVSLDVDVGRMSRFRDAANMVDRDSRRMRTALGSTSRSVGHLRGQMSQTYRARLFGESLRTITRTNDEVQRLRASFVALSAITGTGLTGALSAAYLLQTADRARLLSNQLRTVTTDTADLTNIQERLYDVSQRTRSSLDATTKIYARTARAVQFLGTSQEDLLRITETVQKAFAVGGATQAEATGAAIQLSQGIASDRFSGEEFRSVAENAPVLLQAMARSLGVNIGKLREMAHAGELTGKVVTETILKSADEIDRAFEKTTATVGQSLTRLDNAFLMYIGDVDESYGLTKKLAQAITNLAANFDSIAGVAGDALLVGGAALLGRAGSRSAGSFENVVSRQRALVDARKAETLELAAQQTALRSKIDLEKANYATALTASKAASLTASQRHQANVALQRQLAQINALRKQGIVLSRLEREAASNFVKAQKEATRSATALNMARRAGGAVFSALGGGVGIGLTAAIVAMAAFARQSAKAAEQTDQIVQKLQNMGYLTADAADEMERFRTSVAEGRFAALQNELSEYNDEIDKTISKIREMRAIPEDIGNLTAADFRSGQLRRSETGQRIAEIRDELIKTQEFSEDTRKELDRIALEAPHTAAYVAELVKLAERLMALKAIAMDTGNALTLSQTTSTGPRPGSVIGALTDEKKAQLVEDLEDRLKKFNEDQEDKATGDPFLSRLFGVDFDPDSEYGKRAEAVKELIASMEEGIDKLELEAEMIGKSDFERIKALKTLEIEQDLKANGVTITDELRQQVESLATAYATSTVALDAAKASHEALQEYQRDIIEQNNSAIEDTRGLIKGLITDTVSSLRSGEDAWKSFGDAALNALDLIVNKILDDLLESLINVRTVGQGQGGGLLQSIMSVFGFRSMGSAPSAAALASDGIGLFSGGGYTGDRGVSQAAGVVHGKEFVVNAKATARHRPLLEAINSGSISGYMSGGYVSPVSSPSFSGGMAPIPISIKVSADKEGLKAYVDERASAMDARNAPAVINAANGQMAKSVASGDMDRVFTSRFEGIRPTRTRVG